MLIRENEFQQFIELLQQKHWEGFAYVGYQKGEGPADRYDAYFLSDEPEVESYLGKGKDRDYLRCKSIYRAMQMAQSVPSLLVNLQGHIDLAATVDNYYRHLENTQQINNKNNTIMIENNFDYLNNQVIYGGFKEIPSDELKKQMEQNQKEFQLSMDTAYGTDKVRAMLNFSKSDQSEMYFFNHYDLEVHKEGQKEPMKQRFYINNRGSSITLKEAYNLMEGRAVHKTLAAKSGDTYDAWVQLDFKNAQENGNFKMNSYSEKYGFDLEATLKNYPIKELENQQYKDGLLDSLKRGNRQSVTLVKDGQEVKRFIEATPQYKGINFYDEHNNKRVTESRTQAQSSSKAQSEKSAQTQKTTKGQGVNKNSNVQGEAEAKKKTSRRKLSA